MPRSLLSECSSEFDGPVAAVDAVLEQWAQTWPRGHANARIVEEYLLGRALGVLDVSGRGWRAEADVGTDAEAAATSVSVPPTAASSSHPLHPLTSPPTIVLDDPDGGLVLVAALTGAPRVLVAGDSASAAASCLEAVAVLPASMRSVVEFHNTTEDAVNALRTRGGNDETTGFRVIVDAPKQFGVLREHLRVIGGRASEVVVVGREKHMSSRFNGLLGEAYAAVHVSPGRAKSRLLIACDPKGQAAGAVSVPGAVHPGAPAESNAASPVEGVPDIRVSAFAGTFGGTSIDPGARLLVQAVAGRYSDRRDEGLRVLDLGCGNGWLLAAVGALLPKAHLYGVDVSQAAVDSTALTVASVRPGQNLAVLAQLDAVQPLPWRVKPNVGVGRNPVDFVAGMFDLVTLNPPFHEGTTVTTDTAHALISNAVDLVAPGGRLVVVYNSHLRYRSHLHHRLVDVQQWERDRRFTVVAGTVPEALGGSGAHGETRTPTS